MSIAKIAETAMSAVLRQREEVLSQVISERLGRTDWILADVVGRLERITSTNSKVETFTLDGEPLVDFYPMYSKVTGGTLHVEAKFRIIKTKRGNE
mgnify:CR=1 FL=1